MIATLDAYYRKHRIHPLDFRCRHRDSCAANCQHFTEARASMVGRRYGDPIRVVVLSLDPGAGWDDPDERTFEAVRDRQSRQHVAGLHKGKHWYRTHETVAALLSHFGAEFEPPDVFDRFAHVNAAKCTHNLPAKKQAPAHLFSNCRPYLDGELAILAPHVLITQGRKAALVLSRCRNDQVIEIGDRTVYWLQLVHPNAHGGRYGREREDWRHRFRRARSWLESGKEKRPSS